MFNDLPAGEVFHAKAMGGTNGLEFHYPSLSPPLPDRHSNGLQVLLLMSSSSLTPRSFPLHVTREAPVSSSRGCWSHIHLPLCVTVAGALLLVGSPAGISHRDFGRVLTKHPWNEQSGEGPA